MNEKTLLVTGASSEVGIALIKRVGENYSRIYAHFCSHDQELKKLRMELGEKLFLIQDDFASSEGGKNVVKQISEEGIWPDHVVHLPAPAYKNVKFTKADWEMFEESFHTSVRSAVVILQEVIARVLKDKKEGKILFMLSAVTNNVPPRFISPYVVMKYALLGLVKELSAEYADKKIMVNGISPGMMETRFLKDIPELIIEQNAANSPFGRNLNIEEVLPMFEFLLSDGAQRITGQNIVISGGI